MASINGDNRDNSLTGGNGNDQITGGGGLDFLNGVNGNDVLFGGEDRDTMFGGDGNDLFDSGSGQDVMYGGLGNDTFFARGLGEGDYIDGGDGIDTVGVASRTGGLNVVPYGSLVNVERFIMTDGADTIDAPSSFAGMTIYARAGDDTIVVATTGTVVYGGAGRDEIRGDIFNSNIGRDVFYGEAGGDVLRGIQGDDRLYGGNGTDTLFGGEGNDIVKGGRGNDFIMASQFSENGTGTDNYWGGKGADRFVIEDNGRTPQIVIHDLTRQDTIQFSDLTWGDNRDLPHDFDELLAAARNTREGVSIDMPDGAELLLAGDKLNDLVPQMFDFFFATPD